MMVSYCTLQRMFLGIQYSLFLRVFLATTLMAFLAPVSIALPFTPVPLSMGSFSCLMCALLLQRKEACLTMVSYLFLGACGAPVFAQNAGGLLLLLGPRGGYLVGYLIAAYILTTFRENNSNKSVFALFLHLFFSTLAIWLCGLVRLYFFVPKGALLVMGFYPFFFGDMLKISLLTLFFSRSFSIRP